MAIVVPGNTRTSCDAKCHLAESPGHECECECRGKNHGVLYRRDHDKANEEVALQVEDGVIGQAQGFLL